MSDTGIIIPLKERIRDLETINLAHQKKDGQLRQEIQDEDKIIKELTEKINNPKRKWENKENYDWEKFERRNTTI